MPPQVPFIDLAAQVAEQQPDIDQAIARVLTGGTTILGPEVTAFEREFADYCQMPFSVGVASGLAALYLALKAAEIGPGDEVLTPAHTFSAAVLAIRHAGATPVLVEVDPATFTMDPEQTAAAVTSRTKAILPVHLYGQMADMRPLMRLAKKHGLVVVEDASQAHGARCDGQLAGSVGDFGCFSLYPTKNLGAIGDAGVITVRRKPWQQRLSQLRQYGQRRRYVCQYLGVNERLDELQAAILRVKLRALDRWNDRRRALAARYNKLLADLPLVLPHEAANRHHVYHLYVVRTRRRKALIEFLHKRGIVSGIHYPVAVFKQPAFADLATPQSFPLSQRLANEVLSLPLFPQMSDEQLDYVAQSVAAYFGMAKGSAKARRGQKR